MDGWIKVCGITSAEAALAAVEAGAHAIGFVLAPSVRRQSPEQAARIAAAVRDRVKIVAVTLHPEAALWREIATTLQPDVLQTDLEDYQLLPQPLGCAALPVLRAGLSGPDKVPARILFEGARSGTGQITDWTEAAQWARRTQLVLAGGLHPGNIGDAIRQVRPWGVDASSGLESAPGIKSPQRICDYVRAARAAFEERTG